MLAPRRDRTSVFPYLPATDRVCRFIARKGEGLVLIVACTRAAFMTELERSTSFCYGALLERARGETSIINR